MRQITNFKNMYLVAAVRLFKTRRQLLVEEFFRRGVVFEEFWGAY